MQQIGTLNEYSLHNQLKKHYASDQNYREIKVGNHYIDVIRDNELIEIQTRSFSNLKKKLETLLPDYKVRLVYPIAQSKIIRLLNKDQTETIHIRKSPKRGTLLDAVNELIYIPNLLQDPNLTFEVALVNVNEIRCKDGKGSWRRGGVSILNQELVSLVQTHTFESPHDYLRLLPKRLPKTFTNTDLYTKKGVPKSQAYKLTNFLRKIGVIQIKEKQGRSYVFEVLQ